MEWDDYLEDYVKFKEMSYSKDSKDQAAAIIGHDGSVWAQTTNFPGLMNEERMAIMREFDEPGTLTITGLYLGGTKYVVIGVEPGDVIRANKRPYGVTIKKTSAALVIGMYDNPPTSYKCSMIVERVGEDLIKRGY